MAGYRRGEVLIQSQPFAFIIITPYRGVVCEQCWGRMTPATHQVCPNCNMVCYCSSSCRVSGTAEHRLECLILSRSGTNRLALTDHLRLIVRIWLRTRSEGVHRVERWQPSVQQGDAGTGQGEEPSSLSKCWDYLVDHTKELEAEAENREVLQNEYNELGNILSKVDMPSYETFVNIYSKILVNSFSLRSDRTSTPEHFGTGIYLVASLLNHSCSPNCTVVFQGRQLSIVATKDVPSGYIPNVAFITYVNSLDDTSTRREQLKTTWHFTCDCSLCSNTKFDKQKHSAKCSRCEEGYRPMDTDTWSPPCPCPVCGHSSQDEDSRLLQRYKDMYIRLTVKSDVDFDTMCEKVVEEMGDVYSNSDILYIKAAHHVFTLAVDQCRWAKAITTGEIALAGYMKYYGDKAGLVAAVYVRLGAAHHRLDQPDLAVSCLDEADRIYRVIPGTHSSFYSKEFRPVYRKIVQPE